MDVTSKMNNANILRTTCARNYKGANVRCTRTDMHACIVDVDLSMSSQSS
jgi:hypothetical protein